MFRVEFVFDPEAKLWCGVAILYRACSMFETTDIGDELGGDIAFAIVYLFAKHPMSKTRSRADARITSRLDRIVRLPVCVALSRQLRGFVTRKYQPTQNFVKY